MQKGGECLALYVIQCLLRGGELEGLLLADSGTDSRLIPGDTRASFLRRLAI